MDFNDFIQENKRWLLGCLIGLLAYYIGYSVVDGRTGTAAYRRQLGTAAKTIREEQYRRPQQQAAQQDAELLEKQLADLSARMVYQLPERFSLENRADPEVYLLSLLSSERKRLEDLTYQNNVELEDKAFDWQPPSDRAEIEHALVGVALVAQAIDHLIAAHQKTREQDFGSFGLRSVQSFKLDRLRKARRRGFRGREQKRVAADLLSQISVVLKFEADSRCLHHFLELCRADSNPVTLMALKASPASRPGDPMQIELSLAALALKPIAADEAEEGN